MAPELHITLLLLHPPLPGPEPGAGGAGGDGGGGIAPTPLPPAPPLHPLAGVAVPRELPAAVCPAPAAGRASAPVRSPGRRHQSAWSRRHAMCPAFGIGGQWNGQPGSHTSISHVHNCLQNLNLNLLLILPNLLSSPISPYSVRHSLFQHKYRFFWKCDLFPLILISSCILRFKKQNP